jgi:hypothetical protein
MAKRTGGKRIRSSRAALLPLTLGFMLNSDLQAKKTTAAMSNLAVICAKRGGRQKKLMGLTSAADSGAKSATPLCRGAVEKRGFAFP